MAAKKDTELQVKKGRGKSREMMIEMSKKSSGTWKKGQSGNPKGRYPSLLTKSFLKEFSAELNMPKSDLDNIFKHLLFGKSIEELIAFKKDFYKKGKGDMPAGLAAFISSITEDITKGNLNSINTMLDRVYGKAVTRVENAPAQGMSAEEKKEFLLYKIYKKLHPKQQAIWNDSAKQKMICMPRRWGKSFFTFSQMAAVCVEEPRSRCLYVGRSIKEAEKQLNEMKLDWLHRMGMPPDTDLRDIFPEGSWIDTFGLSPGTDGNSIRGRKYKLVVYDEFFHLREDYLEYFMEQVIAPMQRDYSDWREIRVGTVPETDCTYGGQAWQDALLGRSGWKAYTSHDPDENPNISPFEPWFKEKYPGRDMNEPWVQREFFSRWVFDTESRVFPEWHTYNTKEKIPADKITHILMGVDFGCNDPSAVTGTAWSEATNSGYVFFEKMFNFLTVPKGMIVQEYLDQVCCEAYEKAVDLIGVNNIDKIIWRADSANPADIQRLRKKVRARQMPHARQPINIVGAYKLQSEYMHEEMKAVFRSGGLLVPEGGELEKEMKQTIYRRDETTGLVTNEFDDRFHPNLIVALRYSLEFVLLAKIGVNVNQLAKGRRK